MCSDVTGRYLRHSKVTCVIKVKTISASYLQRFHRYDNFITSTVPMDIAMVKG